MADEQLRAYVQRCLAMGYTRQQVRDRLIEAGYDMAAADSALSDDPVHFSSDPRLPPAQRALLGAGVMTFIIVAAVALLYVRNTNPQAFDEPQFSFGGQVDPGKTDAAPVVPPGKAETPQPEWYRPIGTPAVPARYGWPVRPVPQNGPVPNVAPCTDFRCMAAAAASCTGRSLSYTAPLDFENVTANTTQTFTIGAPRDAGCSVHIQTTAQTILFYEEYAGSLFDLGFSEDQIYGFEYEANEAAARTLPALQQCIVPREALASVFSSWAVGSYTTEQLRPYCAFLYG